jgi:anti-anti-sigma factor
VNHHALAATDRVVMPSNFDDYFEMERHGDKLIVRFKQDVLSGHDELDDLFRRLDEVVNMTPKPDLVLSFRHVSHVSSMFLGKLLALHKQVVRRKGRMLLADVSVPVREVLTLTRAAEYIPVEGVKPQARPAAGMLGGRLPSRWIVAIAVVIVLLALASYLLGR